MFNVIPMTVEHIPEVSQLEKVCFGEHWVSTRFEQELENPRVNYFVVTDASRTVGYIGYWQILEEAHITAVGVDPSCRKKRLAQRLLCRMLDDCSEKGVQWVTLEVKASNIGAQRLYQKFNFSVMGRRKNYYQAEKQDALIMWTEKITDSDYQAVLNELKAEIEEN